MLFSYEEIRKATGALPVNAFSGQGVRSITTDSRKPSPDSLFLAIPGETFDGHDYLADALANGATLLCVEKKNRAKLPPGAPALLVDSTVTAYQQLAAFHRKRCGVKTIALTGSSGKTSTKEMLRAIFEHVFGKDAVLATEGNTNNQIGVPQNLLRLTPRHRFCILEMGTNHPGEIEPLAAAAEPDAGLIVSIGRCHLEFLGSLEGVAREKSALFRHLQPKGTAIIPAHSAGLECMIQAAEGHPILFFGAGADFEAAYLGGNIRGSSFELIEKRTGKRALVEWSLCGAHQAANAAGAAAAASAFGIPLEEIAAGLANCTLPGMRMKRSVYADAQWINDAYNANPDSMRATLNWLAEFADPSKLLLVLGDMREVGELSAAAHEEILRLALTLFPGARIAAVGESMLEAAQRIASPAIVSFPDSLAAAEEVRSMAKPGDIVFLKASRGTRLERIEPARE